METIEIQKNYHAHGPPDAGGKKEQQKEENKNNCRGERYCVEIVLDFFKNHLPNNNNHHQQRYCVEIILEMDFIS